MTRRPTAQRLTQLWALIQKEFLLLYRDKHAVAVLFLMPVVFIFILSLALKDVFADKAGLKLSLEILNLDSKKAFAEELTQSLKKIDQFEVRQVLASSPKSSSAKAKNRLVVLLTLPQGTEAAFDEMMEGGKGNKGGSLQSKLLLKMEPSLDSSYRWFVKATLSQALYEVLLARLSQKLSETPMKDQVAFLDPKNRYNKPSDFFKDETVPTAFIIPNPLQQNVPGWTLFAMFFIAVPLASGVLRERQEGTVKRLLSFPLNKSTLILGKLIPYAVVNLIQFGLMLLVGLYVIPLCSDLQFQLGRDYLGLTLVTLAVVVTATSFGIFVAAVSRSVEQATALSAGCVITMAAIGGIMVPLFAMPDFMQSFAQFSPLYWGHQAYLDVLVREAPFNEIAPKLLVLVGISLAFISIGIRRFRWL